MTARKNYNSVIFLTTLSVYLGLVLVGAPAPVLAQAALTGRIEVKDKIDKKDDLDKKPDDSKDLQKIYSEEVFAEFVKDLQNLQKNHHFNSVEKEGFCKERLWVKLDSSAFYPRETHNLISNRYYPPNRLSSLNDVLGKLIESLDTNDLRNFPAFSGDEIPYPSFPNCAKEIEPKQEDIELSSYPNALSFGTSANGSGVKLETYFVAISEQKASALATKLNAEFVLRVSRTENDFAKQIYENTKVSFSNKQVFIVTRLPRGSLDALLVKESAK